ncbi:MAG: hypothetical protein K5686_01670 [Lachnospiraceae bacterium]|nr:hypothetical protein [Lachnospiraceae bacterium]
MMIDGDVETTWGLLENFEPGSNVYMKFKAPRSISEVRILNVSSVESVPMGILVSADGKEFAQCPYTMSVDGQKSIYKLNRPAGGEYLVFTYGNENSGHWPITEVEIYE